MISPHLATLIIAGGIVLTSVVTSIFVAIQDDERFADDGKISDSIFLLRLAALLNVLLFFVSLTHWS